MFRKTLIAGFAIAALMPTLASAQNAGNPGDGQARCQDQRHDNRVVGTIVGAGLGALLGNAIGEHGGKSGGTIIGGIGGAVAGNAIGAGTVNCTSNQYGRYDAQGRWFPNTATAYGYYDASGRWVETQDQDHGGGYDQPSAYPGRDGGPDRFVDTRDQEAQLQRQIGEQIARGDLDQWRGRDALRRLRDIRRMDNDYRDDDDRMNPDQARDIEARLDDLRRRLSADRGQRDDRRDY